MAIKWSIAENIASAFETFETIGEMVSHDN